MSHSDYLDRLEERWQAFFQRACSYQASHGSLEGLWSQDPETMRWIQNQRTAESNSRLRPDRRELLDTHLPQWRTDQRSRLDRYISHVQEWLRQNPGATIQEIRAREVLEVKGQQVPLGSQTTHYRHRHRAGQLDTEALAKLEQIGWPTGLS